MEKKVEHEGTVASICGDTMIVRIVSSSACGCCAAKALCASADNNEKDIRVESFTGSFVLGERVRVIMQQTLGVRAVCIGYVVPLAVVLTTLLLAYQITENELASGLSSLASLIPYYLILRMFNQKFTKTFGFKVQKI